MSYVFISYNRTQREFADSLAAELEQGQQPVWLDTRGLLPAEPWGPAIRGAILACHSFTVVLDEQWLLSAVCREELDWAIEHGKKIIVVIPPHHTPSSFKQLVVKDARLAAFLPAELSRRNYIWSSDRDIVAVARDVIDAIRIDFEWNQLASWIQQRAVAWDDSGRSHGLLRGDELLDVRRRVDEARDSEPASTRLALEYLRESEVERANEHLLDDALSHWRAGRVAEAVQRTSQAWQAATAGGRNPGSSQILLAHRRFELHAGAHMCDVASTMGALAPGGRWVALAGKDLRVWSTRRIMDTVIDTGGGYGWPTQSDWTSGLSNPSTPITCLGFDGESRRLAASGSSELRVWEMEDSSCPRTLRAELGAINSVEFSADSNWVLAIGENGTALWNLVKDSDEPAVWFAAKRRIGVHRSWITEVVDEPSAEVAVAPLDPNGTISFDRRWTLPETASSIAFNPKRDEWAAICSAQIYRCEFTDDVPHPLLDLLSPIPLEGVPFDKLVLSERDGVQVEAFGFANDLVGVVLSRMHDGAFAVTVGWSGGGICHLAEVNGRLAASAVDGYSWNVIMRSGQLWTGRPNPWKLPGTDSEIDEGCSLALSAGDECVLTEADGTTWFSRQRKMFRRQSPVGADSTLLSRDGNVALQRTNRGAVLWDLDALERKTIARTLESTGLWILGLGASADGSSFCRASWPSVRCYYGTDPGHSVEVEGVQALASSADGHRWVAVPYTGDVATWEHDGKLRSLKGTGAVDPPVKLVVSPDGTWAAFIAKRLRAEPGEDWTAHRDKPHQVAFMDLRLQSVISTVTTLQRHEGKTAGDTLACSPQGRWLVATGVVWEVVDGKAIRQLKLPGARVIDAAFVDDDVLMTVQEDRFVRTWMLDQLIAEGTNVVECESFPVYVNADAESIEGAVFSGNGRWLAFEERLEAAQSESFLIPTVGAHVATALNVPRSHDPSLAAVDDTGRWIVGWNDGELWLYTSTPRGSPITPKRLGFSPSKAVFANNPTRLIVGTEKGVLQVLPLSPGEIQAYFDHYG